MQLILTRGRIIASRTLLWPQALTYIMSAIAVSKGWLATEQVKDDADPCKAADVSPEEIDSARTNGVDWLLEPLRRGTVHKWCGTLANEGRLGAPTGKLAATVDAFIHFEYEYSQSTMVLCDVQSVFSSLDPHLALHFYYS